MGLGQFEPVELVVGPPKTVEIRTVVRVDLDRSFEQSDRLLEPYATVGEHVTEIVQRVSVLWVAIEDLSKRPLGI